MKALETGRSMIKDLRLAKVMMLSWVFAHTGSHCECTIICGRFKGSAGPGQALPQSTDICESGVRERPLLLRQRRHRKRSAQLEKMTNALNECLHSLAVSRKPQLYKRAEQKVASLQRHIPGVVDEIQFQERGWAAYTKRKLDEIHDKLLEGALKR